MSMLKGALQSETSRDSSLLYSVGQLIYTAFGSQPMQMPTHKFSSKPAKSRDKTNRLNEAI